MERFLLFAGYNYEGTGDGWDGFRGDFDAVKDARDTADELLSSEEYDWFHVVDIDTKVKVEGGWRKGMRWIPTARTGGLEMIRTRLNTQVETTVRGYPEVGPYDTEREAREHAGIELPYRATITSVYRDDEGWWAVFTPELYTTTTTLRDFEES